MSRDFDLEPPKAPSAKKEKKSFLHKLFGSKKQETTSPTIPEPKESDIVALREKLGLGPTKSAKEHLDTLEEHANKDADELSKQYDQEQEVHEGSLEDAVSTVEEKEEPAMFIDPSLVEENNAAQQEEDKEELGKRFDVTDFSADTDQEEERDSLFAQEELSQETKDGPSELAIDDEISIDTKTSEFDKEDVSVTPTTFVDEPTEQSSELREETSLVDDHAQEERTQSEFASFDDTPFAQEESIFTRDGDQVLKEMNTSQSESSLAKDFQEAELKAPAQQSTEFDVDEAVPTGTDKVPREDQPKKILTTVASTEVESVETDSLELETKEELSEVVKSLETESKKPEYVDQEESTQLVVQKTEEPSFAAQSDELPIPEIEIEIQQEVETQPGVVAQEEKTITEEQREEALAIAMSESEKAFNKYLKKEEKITNSFLSREKTLAKYIESERKNFVEVVQMQQLSEVDNEKIQEAQSKYEKKLQELYSKKYDAFSNWIQKEADLLRENLDNFKKEVALEKQSISSLKKDVSASSKEYKSLTRKISLAEKQLAKKHAESIEIESELESKRESLINREVEVKAAEKELEDHKQEVYKHIDEHNTILADVQRKIQEAQAEVQNLVEQKKNAKSELRELEKEVEKQKQLILEQKNHLKELEEMNKARTKELDKKDKLLEDLHKQQEKFKEYEKKTQTLLATREESVLDKIHQNEKILRTIQLKQEALAALEEKIESEGFQSYINAKLDQINSDQGILSDEEHLLESSPELGSQIHRLIQDCRRELGVEDFDQAKKIYAQIRHEYTEIDLPAEEKSLLYAKIRELYDDINLGMLRARSEVRSVDIS